MSVIVAQIGARRHYAVPRALYRSGLLELLITDACAGIPPWKWMDRVLPPIWRPTPLQRILDRQIQDIPTELIAGFPLFALSAIWGRKKGERQTDYWVRRNSQFCRLVSQKGFGPAKAVYAFNGAAAEIFQAARERGLFTILDQTSAPWRWNARLLRDEVKRWPSWEIYPAGIDESGELSAREELEWTLADRIISGSDFAVSALVESGGPGELCVVVHYPGPVTEGIQESSSPSCRRTRKGKFCVLFVGTLQLLKGVQYLLQAKKLLQGENITFRLVGPSLLSNSAMQELRSVMDVVGPVRRSEVRRYYSKADVFVLPTLSEGSANVIYEAMVAGLPVVTTPHAGSIVRDGENGLLVPVRDADAIAQAIMKIKNDIDLRNKVVNNSIAMVPKFEVYSSQLCQAVMPDSAG